MLRLDHWKAEEEWARHQWRLGFMAGLVFGIMGTAGVAMAVMVATS